MEHPRLELQDWSHIERRLGGADALSASAREHKALRRRRGIKDAPTLLRLALMYGPGGCPLRSLAALAAAEGLADVSDVALLKRLKAAAPWLEALCQAYLADAAKAAATDTDADAALRLIDASLIKGPGQQAWRLHLCFAPQAGRVVELDLTPSEKGERLDRLAARPGEIRVGDRGYPQPDGLRAMREAGAEVLVRLTWNSVRLLDNKGRPIDWTRLFADMDGKDTLDTLVWVSKPRGAYEPLPMRLVLIRKPAQAAAKARLAARRTNRKGRRRKIDARTVAAADFVILLTSLDAARFPVARLGATYRLRWQVELAFKRLKSLLHIDELRARDSLLARAWLWAHLLFALMIEEAGGELDARPP